MGLIHQLRQATYIINGRVAQYGIPEEDFIIKYHLVYLRTKDDAASGF
jgi:hypothetical protein